MKRILVLMLVAMLLPTYWQGEIDSKIKDVQHLEADLSFGFITDTHYLRNHRQSGSLLQRVIKELDLPIFIHGGDAVSGLETDTKETIKRDIKETRAAFGEYQNRLLFVEGNHDSLFSKNGVAMAAKLTNSERYDLLHSHNEGVEGRIIGGNGFYYQDIDDLKVRFIVLNTNDSSDTRYIISGEQLEWFRNSLVLPKDWFVIVSSHIQPFYRDGLPRGGETAAYILEEFKSSGGKVIGWFSGHIHEDRINYRRPNGITFNIVETLNDDKTVWGDSPTKIKGTISEQAFDIVSVNKNTGVVTLTRIGAGPDRSFNFLTESKQKYGWVLSDARWYYYDQNGLKTGWLNDKGKWYYLRPSDGMMRVGWLNVNNKWYYLNLSSGAMQVGWQKINDKWYYFDKSSGHMLVDTVTPDGYYVDKDGVWR